MAGLDETLSNLAGEKPAAGGLDSMLSNLAKPDPFADVPLPQDRKPTPPPETPSDILTPKGFGMAPEPTFTLGQEMAQPSDTTRRAVAVGVEPNKPIPDASYLASFAVDDNATKRAYNIAAQKAYGNDLKTYTGDLSATGEPEYLDPETGKRALITNPDVSLKTIKEDVKGLAGPAAVAVPELMAGIGAAAVSKNPNITLAAGAGGAFLGEIGRLAYGRAIGVNEGLTNDEILKRAAGTAGISFAAGKAGEYAFRLGRAALAMMTGKRIAQTLARDFGLSVKEAMTVQRQINERLGRDQLRFNVAQASGDDGLLAAQEIAKRSPRYQGQFGDFSDNENKALKAFYDNISAPSEVKVVGLPDRTAETRSVDATVGTLSREPMDVVGSKVKAIAGQKVKQEQYRLQQPVTEMQDRLLDSISDIESSPLEGVAPPVRDAVQAEYTKFRSWADEQANYMRQAAGGRRFIQNENLADTAGRLSDEAKASIFSSLSKPRESFFGDQETSKVFDPNSKWTFSEAWETLKGLKRYVREKQTGGATEAPDVGAMKSLIAALQRDMNESFGDSPLGPAWNEFQRQYAIGKAKLDYSIIGSLMERGPSGRFRIANEKAFNTMFPAGGIRESREVYNVVKDDPQAMQAIREGWGNRYKRAVGAESGRVDLKAHRKFLDQYEESMKPYFTRRELRDIRRPGGLETALQAREQKRDIALKQINNSFNAKLANLEDPNAVFRAVWDKDNPRKIELAMQLLEKTPDVQRGVKAAITHDMLERITDPKTKNLSFRKLDTYLYGKAEDGLSGHARALRAAFGGQYIDDMKLLHKALSIAQRETRYPNYSNTSFWADPRGKALKDLVRAHVGMFTTPGRMMTAVTRIMSRNAEKILLEAASNPDLLEQIAQIQSKTDAERLVAGLLSQSVYNYQRTAPGSPEE